MYRAHVASVSRYEHKEQYQRCSKHYIAYVYYNVINYYPTMWYVVLATSKASDQPAHTRFLIRAFASRFNIL